MQEMPISLKPAFFRVLVLISFAVVNHFVSGLLLWRLARNLNNPKAFTLLPFFSRSSILINNWQYFEPNRRSVVGKSPANYNSFFDAKVAIPARTSLGLVEMTARVNSMEILRGVTGIFRSGEVVLALGDKGTQQIF